MPQKTRHQRARRAKARGSTMTVTLSDVGRESGKDFGKSNHGLKKSGSVVIDHSFYDRSVSHAAPPGGGVHRMAEVGLHPDAAASRFRKNGRRKHPSAERGSFPVAKVNGRKKRPSRMNIKSAGGPRNRSRLHGG